MLPGWLCKNFYRVARKEVKEVMIQQGILHSELMHL